MLLLSALAPPGGLAFIVLALQSQRPLVAAAVGAVAVALAVGVPHVVIRSLRVVQPTAVVSVQTRSRDAEVLAFMATYLLPLLPALMDNTVGGIVTASVTLVFLGIVYIRSDLYYLNPTLTLWGYRLFEIIRDNGQVERMLTRHTDFLPQRGSVRGRRLAAGVLMQVGDE